MPSTICAIVNTSSDTQNGRVVSRAIARDPTMLLTAYQPLALTQFKRAGKYAPRRPKLWRVNASWGIPISGPILAVSASKPHPMRFPTRMAITPSAKPRPKTIASAPTSQTGSPMLAESQSVNNARGRPCRSLAETCSIPCGSTVSTCPRYSPPTSTGFSVELTLLIDISFVVRGFAQKVSLLGSFWASGDSAQKDGSMPNSYMDCTTTQILWYNTLHSSSYQLPALTG